MNAAGIRQTSDGIGATCRYTGLEAPLERLRPWRSERLVAVALLAWMRRPEPEIVLGRQRPPPNRGQRLQLPPGRLKEVAQHLRYIGEAVPSISPEEVAGAAFFMIRNLVLGREVTDYGDVWFEAIQGAPSARSRRDYAQRHRADIAALKARGRRREAHELRLKGAGSYYVRDSLQPKLYRAALEARGYSRAAAYQWVSRHPGVHPKNAPAPRTRRNA